MDEKEKFDLSMLHYGDQAVAGLKEMARALGAYYQEMLTQGLPEDRAFSLVSMFHLLSIWKTNWPDAPPQNLDWGRDDD